MGDSLTVGDGAYLQRELAGVPVRIDAEIGRSSTAGVGVLRARLRPDDDVVVFDLGTNDSPAQPGRLAADLDAARGLADGRCMVLATINRPPAGGATVEGLNEAVRAFAAETPGTQVADWRALAGSEPSLLQSDRVHATPIGYALRAVLVAQAVEGCRAAPGGKRGRRAQRGTVYQPSGLYGPAGRARPVRRDHPAPVRVTDLAETPGGGLFTTLARGTVVAVANGIRNVRQALAKEAPEPVLGAPGS
ncbi:MAG TPA: GDSL-type esterase/lipase family protein [Thermoleophilaceae bacterium]